MKNNVKENLKIFLCYFDLGRNVDIFHSVKIGKAKER